MQLRTNSVDETLALGRLIGQLAPAAPYHTCVPLHGQLGAGKTHLTRGIALGAQVEDPTLVSSPTYVLLNIYKASEAVISPAVAKSVFHMDAYRLSSEEDFAAVGFDELLTTPGISVIEWASRISHLLPDDRLEITIEAGEEESERLFTLAPTGPQSEKIAREIADRWQAFKTA